MMGQQDVLLIYLSSKRNTSASLLLYIYVYIVS